MTASVGAFVFLLFAPLVAASNFPGVSDDPLLQWLHNLTVHLPPIKEKEGIFTIEIPSMVCRDITLGDIESSFTPPSTITFKVKSLGIDCFGPFMVGSGSCKLEAAVRNAGMELTISFHDDKDGLVAEALVPHCDSSFPATGVHLTFTDVHDSILIDIIKNKVISAAVSGFIATEAHSQACKQIKTVIERNLTSMLLDVDTRIRPYLKPPVPAPLPPVPAGSADLRGNALVDAIRYASAELLGPSGVNFLAGMVTHDGGSLVLDARTGGLFQGYNVTVPIRNLGNVTLGINRVSVDGLASWSGFGLLEPVGRYLLRSHTLLDRLAVNVSFSVRVLTAPLGPVRSTPLYEEGELSGVLTSNSLRAVMQLAVSEARLRDLNTAQITEPGCLLSAVSSVNFTELTFNVTVEDIRLTAVGGGNTERQLDETIDNVLALFVNGYGHAIPAFMNYLSAYPLREALNSRITPLIEAHSKCPDVQEEPLQLGDPMAMACSAAGAGAAFVGVTVWLCCRSRRRRKSASSGTGQLLHPSPSSATEEERDDAVHGEAAKKVTADILAFHKSIPVFVKYGMPLVLLANMTMFVWSNTSYAATVQMILTVGDDRIRLPSLFNFSLGNSVQDMWRAGVYPLAIIIAVFSGFWPYVKLALMLACWCLPFRMRWRETLLRVLDALGKWSLIDNYVMTLMMVAFRFHIAPDPLSGTPGATVAMDVIVESHWGFFVFLGATVLSLTLSHILLFLHRRAAVYGRYPVLVDKRRSLRSLAALAPGKCNKVIHKTQLVVVVLTWSLGMTIVGIFIDSYMFEFKGAAAVALDFLKEPSKTSYSLWSTGVLVPSASDVPNSLGIRTIQIAYFIFAVGMPLLHGVLLLTLWLLPMTPIAQQRVFSSVEVVGAWSALEVFVVSIIAALLELNQFAQFIIGNRCDLINALLRKYANSIMHGDDRCFSVTATLDHGCWVLFSACVLSLAAGTVVMRTSHKLLHERNEDLKRASLMAQNSEYCGLLNGTGSGVLNGPDDGAGGVASNADLTI